MSGPNHILDKTDDSPSNFEKTGQQFAKASAVLHIIAIMAGFFAYWNAWQANNALQTAGAPDSVALANAIYYTLIACICIFPCLAIGQILRYWAYSKYELRPVYLWRIQLYTALFVFPFNWLISGFILIHLLLKKDVYE
jgi:hypothetical protein